MCNVMDYITNYNFCHVIWNQLCEPMIFSIPLTPPQNITPTKKQFNMFLSHLVYKDIESLCCNTRHYNEWMNDAFHIALLLCIAIHPKRFTIKWGGGGSLSSTTTSVQHPLGWCDGSHRTTAPVRSPHTSYRWRGERDRANQVDGDY